MTIRATDEDATMLFFYAFGTDNSTDRLSARNGQPVTVVRPLNDDECDIECQPMFRVRASDGHEFDAFEEELQA